MAHRKRVVAAGFIDKDQPLDLLLLAPLPESCAGLAANLGILLGGVKRLFFRVSPSCLSARGMVARPTCTGAVAAKCSYQIAFQKGYRR
jgi:hypothetical protein